MTADTVTVKTGMTMRSQEGRRRRLVILQKGARERGTGEVWMLTVQKYLESSRWKRFACRLARNPVVLFVLAPHFLFLVPQRFPSLKAGRRERHSVHWTGLAVLGVATGLSLISGLSFDVSRPGPSP
jgi:hypothetical protein